MKVLIRKSGNSEIELIEASGITFDRLGTKRVMVIVPTDRSIFPIKVCDNPELTEKGSFRANSLLKHAVSEGVDLSDYLWDDTLRKDLAGLSEEMKSPSSCDTDSYESYTPACPLGWVDCISDPAYIKRYHPDYYKSLYGDISPEEAAEKSCRSHATPASCDSYDDEDK